jgi:exosome complex RNA-binding protein Rrp4
VEEVVRQEAEVILAGIQCRKPNVIKDQTARIQTIHPTRVPWIIERTNSIRIILHLAENLNQQIVQGVGGVEWIRKVHREYNRMQIRRIQIRSLNKGLKKRPKKMREKTI